MLLSEDNISIADRLQRIKRQLVLLMERDQELEKQIETLKEENRKLKNLAEVQKNTIKDVEEKNKISKLAGVIVTDEAEGKVLKNKINEYLRDIDKCIKLLNE